MKDKNYSKEITGRIPVNTDYSEIPINKVEEVSNPTITFTEQLAAGADFDIDNDRVNNPSHYQSYVEEGGLDCITAMIHAFGREDTAAFCKLNAFKYIWRSSSKGLNEDIRKAIWYLNKYLELGGEDL